MELFPDGAHVRLRSHLYGTYLHADEDGLGVSLHPERASMNVAWKVHRIVRNDVTLLLLYGAAYGRYLAATLDPAPFGHRGQRVVQGVYDDQEDNAVVWSPSRVAAEDGQILLQTVSHLRLLRANGKYFKWRRTGVSVDSYFNRTSMMHWKVEVIPPLPAPPIFAPPDPPAPQTHRRRGIIGLFRRRPEPTPVRTIRYVRADDHGNFNDQAWGTFQFSGRSAYNLRNNVATLTGFHFFFYYMSVCARPGRFGRLTPLIADLPLSQEPMDVIGVINGTPVEAVLLYPNLNAP